MDRTRREILEDAGECESDYHTDAQEMGKRIVRTDPTMDRLILEVLLDVRALLQKQSGEEP